ncbi:MAG: hypothetical protein O2923_04810 [Verrucomicrobia bacterium]|nr:hypothetical protein [Verrucomicrobiota bacterium]
MVVVVAVVLASIEAALRVGVEISPRLSLAAGRGRAAAKIAHWVPDDRVGRRPSPDYPGHGCTWISERHRPCARGITVIDGAAALRDLLSHGVQPYPESIDGHPNADGHRAIAEAVRDGLGDALVHGKQRSRFSIPR